MQVVDTNGNIFGAGLEVTGPDGKPKTISGGGGPTGPAGGDLSGTYPNPSVIWNNGTSTYGLLYYPLSTNPSGFITASALTPYLTITLAASTYYPIPTGTVSQYIRGDGTLATFPTIPSITPAALTKTDDTNVTLTLGGTPTTALLQSTSLTLGWTGTLADLRIASATTWNAKQNAITTGTTAQYFRGDLSLATFPSIPTVTPAALTKVDDTNVTLSLGGTPSTSLLQSTSLTLGWTGTLADSRITSAATWNNKVTSLSSGTGISIGGTTTVPIVTNTAPDQTVSLSNGAGISVTGTYPSFTIASTITQYTDALARLAISLTTTGTSGAATYNSTTGVLNIPQYGGGTIIKLTSQTLSSASWILVSGFYTYTFTNVNITVNTRVDFTPNNTAYLEVTTCGMQTQVTVAAGSCIFYSLFPPQTNITGEITIFPT